MMGLQYLRNNGSVTEFKDDVSYLIKVEPIWQENEKINSEYTKIPDLLPMVQI